MELHTLHPFKNTQKKKKRIGRGLGSGHGSYSTRGIKGQRARSGGKKGLKARGLKMFLLRIPKSRGFKSIHDKARGINVEVLEKHFNAGDMVTPAALVEKKVVRGTVSIKILGGGAVTKKLILEDMMVSETARAKIEAAGGTITLRKPKEKPKKRVSKQLQS